MSILAITAAWLTSLGIPVQAPPVVVEQVPEKWTAYTKGGVIHALPDRPSAWQRGDRGQELLHEMAHVAAWQAGHRAMTREDHAIEEGAAQSLDDDLADIWTRKYARSPFVWWSESAYPVQAAWLRGMSAAGCRCDPDSRDARRWRWRFITGDRAAMLAAAASVPTDGVE